jgi:hypothetical protein
LDKNKPEANLGELFLGLFPDSGDVPLPIPRFGKIPLQAQQAQALPAGGSCAAGHEEPFCLSWIDESELGIRVFVREEQGAKGTELWAFAEGIVPDLLGKGVSVALVAAKANQFKRLTVSLDTPTEDNRGCRGKRSFGAVSELRKQLGERVSLDVFLVE